MATLTYDPTPSDQPEFSEAEQEALQIGEEAIAEQNKMLAGKFEDAEALEKAYIELQQKLGQPKDEPVEEQGVRNEEEAPEEEVKEEEEQSFNPATAEILTKASEEFYANDGQISEETLKSLEGLDSSELVAAYIAMQGQQGEAEDFDQSQVDEIQSFAGGAEQYTSLMNWAGENMPQNFVEAFDNLVAVGNPDMIKLAVAGLQSAYVEANGYEGRMLTGKASQEKADVFRSQAEVVQAMSDPRYDRDPAYRQDVFAKLDRSNLDY